jgi:hypothetical protein
MTHNITEMKTALMIVETEHVMLESVLVVLFTGLNIIILTLGNSGNTLVVYIIIQNKLMQTVTITISSPFSLCMIF